MKVGVVLPQYATEYAKVREMAVECELLGYDSIWLEDHFMPWAHDPKLSALECWTTLAALATVTSRIIVGTLCTCNSYRYPSVVAKMAASLDTISNGRLILGIGAGWYEDEYNAYGISYPQAKERIERLSEAVQIIKMLWTEEKSSFKGKYYRVNDAVCDPKPVQKPHPPLWIGGGGEKLMLKVVAQHADCWNYGAMAPQEFRRKHDILKKYCNEIGRSHESISTSLELSIFIGRTEEEFKEKVKRYLTGTPSGQKPQHLIRAAYLNTSIQATPDRCAKALKEYVDVGVQHFTLVFPDAELSSLRTFSEEVIPSIR